MKKAGRSNIGGILSASKNDNPDLISAGIICSVNEVIKVLLKHNARKVNLIISSGHFPLETASLYGC